jgi:hypothetical protein
MYEHKELKEKIFVTETSVDCPVKECNCKVDRQRKVFRKFNQFKCSEHKIYISHSTFEYENENENLLWTDEKDIELLDKIKKVKRESRMARNNSEDALTWNVFRYLDKNNQLSNFLSVVLGQEVTNSQLILWSYSETDNGSWPWLDSARIKFGENIKRGSEPDIIVLTDKTLFFIEAKLFSGNATSGSGDSLEKHLNNPKDYITGDNNWFFEVFASNYKPIVTDQKYELMRLWLLGSWIAKELNKEFHLVNLVLDRRETIIEDSFGKHIKKAENRHFSRITWESIYSFLKESAPKSNDTKKLKEYFENKTCGYNSKYILKKAFSI